MPTPKRDVRIADNLYKPAQKKAADKGFSEIVRQLLAGWLAGKFKL